MIQEERKSPSAKRYLNNNASNEVIHQSKRTSVANSLDNSLEQVQLSKRKVGSGDEMPQMPTMSMRAAQHDLTMEREKFHNKNGQISNNTFQRLFTDNSA